MWMGLLQKFHLVIKYKNANTNKFVDMLSRPPTSNIIALRILMHMEQFTHDTYKETYLEDEDFKEVYQQLYSQSHVHDDNRTIHYHLEERLVYRLDELYAPKIKKVQLIREAQRSKVVGQFGLWKTMANLHRYLYCPQMQE